MDVSTDGGTSYTSWLTQTQAVSAAYSGGTLGRCHLFRVTATDHVSNESSVVAAWQTCVPQQVVKYYVHSAAWQTAIGDVSRLHTRRGGRCGRACTLP